MPLFFLVHINFACNMNEISWHLNYMQVIVCPLNVYIINVELLKTVSKLYSSFKRTQEHDKRKSFLTLRQQIKSKMKSSYLVYLDGLLGLLDEDSKCDSKRLFSFLGKSKEYQRGISSLTHDSDLI